MRYIMQSLINIYVSSLNTLQVKRFYAMLMSMQENGLQPTHFIIDQILCIPHMASRFIGLFINYNLIHPHP